MTDDDMSPELEQRLRHAHDVAKAYLDRMIERMEGKPLWTASQSVRAEINALETIIVVADIGLKAPWRSSQQNSLDGIKRLLQAWDERGYSAELTRAVAIEQFAQLEAPSDAVN